MLLILSNRSIQVTQGLGNDFTQLSQELPSPRQRTWGWRFLSLQRPHQQGGVLQSLCAVTFASPLRVALFSLQFNTEAKISKFFHSWGK